MLDQLQDPPAKPALPSARDMPMSSASIAKEIERRGRPSLRPPLATPVTSGPRSRALAVASLGLVACRRVLGHLGPPVSGTTGEPRRNGDNSTPIAGSVLVPAEERPPPPVPKTPHASPEEPNRHTREWRPSAVAGERLFQSREGRREARAQGSGGRLSLAGVPPPSSVISATGVVD